MHNGCYEAVGVAGAELGSLTVRGGTVGVSGRARHQRTVNVCPAEGENLQRTYSRVTGVPGMSGVLAPAEPESNQARVRGK